MPSEASCHHRSLVVGSHCRVEQCSRGHIHVTLGDVTLRLRPKEFIAAATALHLAAGRLDPPDPESPSATRLLC